METITGVITEVRTARHTIYGNPIKSVTLSLADEYGEWSPSFETLPNAQLGYMVGNYTGKAVVITIKNYRGTPRIESVELAN